MREMTAHGRHRRAQAAVRSGAGHLRGESAGAVFRGAAAPHGRLGPRRRPRAGDPAAAVAVERRSDHGAARAPLTANGTLSPQASRLRAAARLRGVVGGAAADAAGPRRLHGTIRRSWIPRHVNASGIELGLDRPLAVQYLSWLGGVVRFDFGRSILYSRPVSTLLGERALNTAMLATAALLLATAIGIPLGIYSGSRTRGLGRSIVRALSVLGDFGAAADRLADAGVHRGADGLVSGRRHDVLRRTRSELGRLARRSRAASPGARARPRHSAGRGARTAAVASHRRGVARARSSPPAARAASSARRRCCGTRGRCRCARCLGCTA